VSSVSVKELIDNKSTFQKIENYSIGIPELSWDIDEGGTDNGLLPYSKQTFPGFRLLHEYFSFQEKFFFVSIKGLEKFKDSGESHPFEIRIDFNKKLPREKSSGQNDILLHCSPIINLFSRPAEEVIVNQRRP